jgi:hypothetical protein
MKLNTVLLNENKYSFLPKYDGGIRQATADFRGNKPRVSKMKIPAAVSVHGATELMDLDEFPTKESFMKYYKVVKKQGGEIRIIK